MKTSVTNSYDKLTHYTVVKLVNLNNMKKQRTLIVTKKNSNGICNVRICVLPTQLQHTELPHDIDGRKEIIEFNIDKYFSRPGVITGMDYLQFCNWLCNFLYSDYKSDTWEVRMTWMTSLEFERAEKELQRIKKYPK